MKLSFSVIFVVSNVGDDGVGVLLHHSFICVSVLFVMDTIEGVPEIASQSLKSLGDKSYEKRKAAAQEITTVVSKLYV